MFYFYFFFCSSPCKLCFGISIRVNPSFQLLLMRCSMRLTGRISPLSPTSPAIHTPASISVSILLERMALMTARSMAGSFTFQSACDVQKYVFLCQLESYRFFPELLITYSYASGRILLLNAEASHRLQY